MYSRCLKIWLIARISFLSDANITYMIFINLQYSNKTYNCISLYGALHTSKFKSRLG